MIMALLFLPEVIGMAKIDTREWKEFRLGKLVAKSEKITGNGLFHIHNSTAYHGKDVSELDRNAPNGLNYVTRSKFNNGVKCKIADTGKYDINPAGTISFGAENANFFYQTEPYITGNKMYYIDVRGIPELACYFIKSVLEATFTANYSFSDGMVPERIYNEKIKLPSTPDGLPDYKYMEDYMRALEEKTSSSLTALQSAQTSKNKKLDVQDWEKFHLYDIFEISMGNKFDKSKMQQINPTVSFVGRSGINNGVACEVDLVKDKNGEYVQPYKAGDMTIAMGGSVGSTFVQEKDFYTSQNVCVLHTDNPSITSNVKHFIAAVIMASCSGYEAFVEELNKHIRTDFTIRLPVDSDGHPDWDYMDKYMKEIEEKIEKQNLFSV